MKKELLISLLALLAALVAAMGVWHRDATVAFANDTGGRVSVSSVGTITSASEPGAWIVAADKVYLVRADYDFNDKTWSIRQLATSQLTPNP